MSHWFDEWFASPEYLSVYRRRDSEEAARVVALILSVTGIPHGASVLDLGCGAGRHALGFCRRGLNVTGIDLSEQLIAAAKNSAAAEGLQPEFLCQDINTLELRRHFDLTVSLFTSFGYFDDDEKNFHLFRIAASHLKPGGFFVFDYLNPEHLKQALVPLTKEIFDSSVVEQLRWMKNDYCHKRIIIQRGDTLCSFRERVKLYSLPVIERELNNTGFEVFQLFGDYSGEEFNALQSPRMLIVCKK
jgi:SAM-dependent methyltransferase